MSVGVQAQVGRLSLSRVAEQTFSIIRQDFATSFGFALAATVPPLLLGAWRAQTVLHAAAVRPANPSDAFGRFFGPAAIVVGLISLFCLVLIYAALSWGAVERLQGRAPSLGEKLTVSVRALPVLIGIGILGYFGVVFGIVCLIVPGLFLLTCWSLVAPVVAVEKRGVFAGFGRSFELTRGHRWTIFLVLLIYWIACVVVALLGAVVVRLMFGVSGNLFLFRPTVGPALWASLVVNLLIGALTRTVGATGIGVIYSELRGVGGGFDTRRLSDVFA